MSRSGSPYSTPRDANRVPLLVAASTADGVTPVVLEADPATHALVTSGGGSGGGGTQYTDGATAITHPVGTQPVFTNGSNVVTAVSTANPLPITGSISVGSTSDSSTFTAGSSTTGPVAGVFNDSATALTSGQQGTTRSTANRALHTNLRNNSGTEIGTSTTPLQVSLANTATNATAVKVDGSAVTQPVSAASLPLPTGASTDAKQDAGNTSVASIDTKTPVLGQALAAASVPVVLTAAQLSTITPPASITGYALEAGGNLATVAGAITASVVQENVKQINGVIPLMGNGTTGTGSQRVTIASDNTAFTVNASQSGTWNITNVSGTVSLPTGAATSANQSTEITSLASIATNTTSLTKVEDASHSSGDTGVFALGVRNDTLAATTNASADYTQLSTDQAGIVITAGAPRALKGRQATTLTSSTSETTIVTAVASTFLDLYGLVLTNTSATTTKVSVRDATSGGTITIFEVPAGDTRGFMLPVDSAMPQATVNNNWTAQCGTSVASLEVTALYVKRV